MNSSHRETFRPSKNKRHDTISDVQVFLQKEHPERARTVEIVCSSARRDMDQTADHTPFRLFSHTIKLEDECMTTWPTQTDACCWHCCHQFESMPISIPKSTVSWANNMVHHVYGIFCSCNCATAYILERNTYDQQQLLLRFKDMVKKLYQLKDINSNVYALEPAPPRIFLKMFGGHLTIEEFRAKSITVRSMLVTPPFISYRMVMEESARLSKVNDNTTPRDGIIKPITTHTIRGLRRPTTVVNDATEENTTTVSSIPCLFDTFISTKENGTVDSTQDDVNNKNIDIKHNQAPCGNNQESESTVQQQQTGITPKLSQKTEQPITRRAYKRASASSSSSTGVQNNNNNDKSKKGGAGTLAAFLR